MEQARRGGRADRAGRGRPADRHSSGDQGLDLHSGRRDNVRVEDPEGLRAAVRRSRDRAAERGRVRDARQDEHGRVRDGLQRRELRLRPDVEPVGARPRARRVFGRLGGGGGGRHGVLRARLGHRRLDPPAGVALGRRRAEADVRARLALRAGGLRLVAGPDRAVHALRARRRARLPGDRRPRRARLNVGAGRGAGLRGVAPGAGPARAARRRADGVLRRGDGRIRPRVGDGGDQPARVARARRSTGRSRCPRRATRWPSTTSSRRPRRRRTWRATTA